MAKALGVFLLPIILSVLSLPARAASVEEFYKGKTIQWIVGGTAGGGYDTYTRLIARHFPQYVPITRILQPIKTLSRSGIASRSELQSQQKIPTVTVMVPTWLESLPASEKAPITN